MRVQSIPIKAQTGALETELSAYRNAENPFQDTKRQI